MVEKKFDFGEHFESIIIISILGGDHTYLSWLKYLKPEYFNTPHLGYFFNVIKSMEEADGVIPTIDLIKEVIRTDNELSTSEKQSHYRVLRKLKKFKLKIPEVTYALKKMGLFVKRQRYLLGIDEGLNILDNGNLNQLDKMFLSIINTGAEETMGGGLFYFKEPQERLFNISDNRVKRYKLLIPELDKHLRHGGMKPGETIFWLASTGSGKTMSLIHSAKSWLIQKLKGVYYTLQLPEEDIAERFDAAFSGVLFDELLNNSEKINKTIKKYGKKYGDALIIKYFPRHQHSIQSIDRHLQYLKREGFEPNFIVIDFLNFLAPAIKTFEDSTGSKYYRGADVAGEVIAYCQQHNLLGATGIQAHRAAKDVEVVTIENVAESYGSVMEATLVVSINRKAEERKTEKARLFIAKYTYGKDQIILPINTNYGKGSLYRRI